MNVLLIMLMSTSERLNLFTPPAHFGCIFLWILMHKTVLFNYTVSQGNITGIWFQICGYWWDVKCIHWNLFCEKHHICHLAIVNRNQKSNWQLTRWMKNIEIYQFPRDMPRYIGITVHILWLCFHKYWICSWIQQFCAVSSTAMQDPSSNVYQSYSTYSCILV